MDKIQKIFNFTEHSRCATNYLLEVYNSKKDKFINEFLLTEMINAIKFYKKSNHNTIPIDLDFKRAEFCCNEEQLYSLIFVDNKIQNHQITLISQSEVIITCTKKQSNISVKISIDDKTKFTCPICGESLAFTLGIEEE